MQLPRAAGGASVGAGRQSAESRTLLQTQSTACSDLETPSHQSGADACRRLPREKRRGAV